MYGYMFEELQFIAQNLYTFSKPSFYLSCFIFLCNKMNINYLEK